MPVTLHRALLLALLVFTTPAFAQDSSRTPSSLTLPGGSSGSPTTGTVDPGTGSQDALRTPTFGSQRAAPTSPTTPAAPAVPPSTVAAEVLRRNEFQDFVEQSIGRVLPMFGYNLFLGVPSTFAPVENIPVTPDYVIGPGDEVMIRAWGQVDVDHRAVVDRNGVINIPRVGNVSVAGIRYQALEGYLKNAIGRIFRNFDLSVALGQLRSMQVFVVGHARRPGNYTVSSLSTLVNAVFAAGGPAVTGSMRSIQLKRGNQLVTDFDLYDLLLKGDKSKDVPLLPGDVIYFSPISNLAAIAGSVNEPAIYELKGKTTLDDLIRLSGGLSTTASGQKVTVERIDERKVRKVDEFELARAGLSRELKDGDLVRVFALSPKFDNAVTLRGSVASPGRYPWREGLRVRDIIPDKDALIAPDYWRRQNRPPAAAAVAPQQGDAVQQGQGRAPLVGTIDPLRLRIEVKRSYEEINWDYAVVERLNYDDLTTMLIPFHLGRAILENDPSNNVPLRPGDVVTIFSKEDIQVPVARQTKYVRLEGEIATSGIYQIMPGETLRQLVARVGGLTANAYLFGSEFTRESTRVFQQQRLDEAIDFLDREIQRNFSGAAAGSLTKEDAETAKLQAEGQRQLVARLRQIRATGRIVLELSPERAQLRDLPDLALDDGDRFVVPARPSTVSVVGAVYNQNAFLYRAEQRVSDLLFRAGGPTRDADTDSLYVVRADGSVISKRQAGWLFDNFQGQRLMPGDTVVVPESLTKFSWTKELRDWSQIFYQFALGVAGLKVLQGL